VFVDSFIDDIIYVRDFKVCMVGMVSQYCVQEIKRGSKRNMSFIDTCNGDFIHVMLQGLSH
jgi:hypothetical protein